MPRPRSRIVSPGWVPGGDLDRDVAVERRHLDRRAERGQRRRDVDDGDQVLGVAQEALVLAHPHDDVEVAVGGRRARRRGRGRLIRIRWPSEIPGGTSTSTFWRRTSIPRPPQVSHGRLGACGRRRRRCRRSRCGRAGRSGCGRPAGSGRSRGRSGRRRSACPARRRCRGRSRTAPSRRRRPRRGCRARRRRGRSAPRPRRRRPASRPRGPGGRGRTRRRSRPRRRTTLNRSPIEPKSSKCGE